MPFKLISHTHQSHGGQASGWQGGRLHNICNSQEYQIKFTSARPKAEGVEMKRNYDFLNNSEKKSVFN